MMDNILISGSKKVIKVWKLSDMSCIRTIEGHQSWVDSITVLCDDQIASASDKTIKIYDLNSGKCVQTFQDAHNDDINSVIMISRYEIASSSDDQTIKIWNLESKGSDPEVLNGHTGGVKCLLRVPSIDNQLIASGSDDGTIKIWNIRTPKKTVLSLESHESTIWHLVWVSRNKIASASDDFSIKIWDLASKRSEKMSGHTGAVFSLCLLEHLKLASSSADQTIRVWDMSKLECTKVIEMGHNKNINSLVLVGDNEIASGSNDKTIKIWNLDTFECHKVLEGHANGVFALTVKIKSKKHMMLESREKEIVVFLNENNFFNFNVVFSNTVIKCFKPLLSQSELDLQGIDEVKFDHKMNIDESILTKVLFGVNDVVIKEEDYFELFVFFDLMKMKNLMYAICKRVQQIDDLEVLLILFLKALRKYENKKKEEISELFFDMAFENLPEDNEIVFNSVFTLNVFGILKKNYEKIITQKRYIQFLDKVDYLAKFMNEENVQKIETHKFFESDKKNLCYQFDKNFELILNDLFHTKKYHNLVLKTKDRKSFKVHREVLIFKSNFFLRMFKFPGKEFQSMIKKNEILVEFLTSKVLFYLIQFIYLNHIDTDNLEICFVLLQHAEMYFESEFENYLIKKINHTFYDAYKKYTFESELIKRGYLVKLLPEEMQQEFVDFWSLNFDANREKILSLIEESISKYNKEESYKKSIVEYQETIADLKRKLIEKEGLIIQQKTNYEKIIENLKLNLSQKTDENVELKLANDEDTDLEVDDDENIDNDADDDTDNDADDGDIFDI